MTERVDSSGDSEGELSSLRSSVDIRLIYPEEEVSVGKLAEGESSSLGSLLEIKEEETDPRVKEEVGSTNGGIFNSIEVYD